MFIVGLGLGTLGAVVLGDLLIRSHYFSRWLSWLMLALVLIFCAFFSAFSVELRSGLVPGILLGTLLLLTPERLSDDPEPERLA